jgi:hypothetical protein
MRIVLLALLCIAGQAVFPQQLVNGGFEEWIWDYDTPYPRPAGWECNNHQMNATRDNLPVQACVIPRTGNFSSILWSVTDTVTAEQIPAHLWQSVNLNGERPAQLVMYVRYDVLPDAPAAIEVEFFDRGKFLHKQSLLFSGRDHLDSFERRVLPIQYPYQLLPDSAVVHIRNEVSESSGTSSSMINVDDIQFVYSAYKNIGSIFPNPATDRHYITAEGFKGEHINIEVFDMAGRLVRSREFSVRQQYENIPLEALPEGMFIYRLWSGNDVYTRKVLAAE